MPREGDPLENSSSPVRAIAGQRTALLRCVLDGQGLAPPDLRRAAFENAVLTAPLRTLIEKVVWRPTEISAGDFTAVQAAGHTEDQLFELVVCAAVGAADRQFESALQALVSAESKA